MSPLKKPKSLSQRCHENVKDLLVGSLSVCSNPDMDPDVKQYKLDQVRQHYLEWLMPNTATKILDLILRDDQLHPETRVLAFRVLFTEHSKSLGFVGSYQERYHRQITNHLKQISERQPRLEVLNTRGVWFQSQAKEGYRESFYDALRYMPNLKQVTVPYVADDQLLRLVSANCPQLTVLDLSGAMELTDAGVKKCIENLSTTSKKAHRMSILSNLKYINLGGPGGKLLQPGTVAEVLYAFQNLVSLGSYPFMGQVLDHLQYEIDGYYQTRLRYYHDRKTNHDTTELMSYCCPELIHIYLDSPDPGVTKSVFKNHAGKLRNFKVSRVNCQELNDIFEEGPKSLVSLELVNGRDSLDLYQVAKSCYHLQTLEIYYSMGVHVSKPAELSFPSLKKLSLYATDLRGNYSASVLKSCPQIEKLTLTHCGEGLTDDAFFEVLETNPMPKCKDLCLVLAPYLTTRSIWTVMTCCDSVTFLGKLDTWNVNYAEVEEIRSEIRSCNMDLELWETFDSFDREDAMENFIRMNREMDQLGMVEQVEQ